MRRRMLRALSAAVVATTLTVVPATAGVAGIDRVPAAVEQVEPASDPEAVSCTKAAAQVLAGLQQLGAQAQFTTVRHRGDFDTTTPENSLQAFRNSYRACRPGVETDLRHTKDGELVMFHDTHVGKMMEPTYDPVTNTGPNAALTSLTLAELKQKRLVDINRNATPHELVTLHEFLEDAAAQGGPSLLFIEVKDNGDILQAVEEVRVFSTLQPNANIFDRVVFKIKMSAFPTFASWKAATNALGGLPRTPLSQVMISRVIADEVDRRTDLGNPSTQTPSYFAARTWATANATSDGVLSVEVTMKDSVGFYDVEHRKGYADGTGTIKPFADVEYYSPTTMGESNARPGTMAQITAMVRASGKPLGQFVPIPDWVMWREGQIDWDRSLPSVVGNGTPISPRDAYFQNDSRCCYALQHRLADTGADPEQNEQRTMLPWLQDLGATVLTADDTDSIDFFFSQQGKLYDLGRPTAQSVVSPAPLEMNSVISPVVNQFQTVLRPTMMMVSVRSLEVTDIDGENPGDLYGNVRFWDASAQPREPLSITRANYRSHYPAHPAVAIDAAGQSLLGRSTLRFELWDRDDDLISTDDLIAGRSITIPEDTPDGVYTVTTARDELFETSTKGSQRTYGSAKLTYTVQRYWINADLRQVRVDNIDGEDPGELYGTITTGHVLQDTRMRSDNFLARSNAYHSIGPGGFVPLHSHSAPGFGWSVVMFDLWDDDGLLGTADPIANFELSITNRDTISDDTTTRHVQAKGMVTVTTAWDAGTRRTPQRPLTVIPVEAADGS